MTNIVLLSKKDSWCAKAGLLAKIVLGERVVWLQGSVGEPIPKQNLPENTECIISFLSPWIVPKDILEGTAQSINFHPASRDYPGIGCYNFCLYEEAEHYGATCHHMAARVDSGPIIEERRFPVLKSDTVETLKFRTMVVMLALFHDIISKIANGDVLPQSKETWSRPAFTRAQLNQLCQITPDLSSHEIAKRVRATTYPGYPGARVVLGDTEFSAAVPDRNPIA